MDAVDRLTPHLRRRDERMGSPEGPEREIETAVMPLNLREYEEAAQAVLPSMAFDYMAGGSGDEVTLRANRAAFEGWSLVPRVLRGSGQPDLSTTVLGHPIDLPVVFAPVAFQRLV